MFIKIYFILFIGISISFSQNSETAKSLTNQIINETDNDSTKIVKISKWITNNIKYNTKAYKELRTYSVNEILKKKTATNQGYSKLFTTMLNYAKIKNSQIIGYYKGVFYENNDEFLRANHTWNAAFINNKWYLFDITLASGYLQNSKSSNANLQKIKWVKSFNKDMLFADVFNFRKTHFPLQKYWQLTDFPITVTQFENGIYYNKSGTKYNFVANINSNYVKRPKQKNIIKNIETAIKENPKNTTIIGCKYNMQAVEIFKPIKQRSVSTEIEYKKILANFQKLNKKASLQFAAHIRNIKKQYKQKGTKNKNFNLKNTKQINAEIKLIAQHIAKRKKIIEQLNKKNEIFLNLIETYEKNKINDENKSVASEQDINKITKLKIEYSELKKALKSIKEINTDTIKYKIKSINVLEDSVTKMLNYRLNFDKQKTNFITNFSFNRLSIYNNINDSIKQYKKTTSELINEFNSNVDTSYFNIETKLKLLVKQAESHYKKAKTIIVSKKMENAIFTLFNNTIDSVYNNAQIVLKANISSFKPMIKKLNKDYFTTNKNILSELNNQLKSENERYNNFNEYYNSLQNQEIILFNNFIEKCNKRITKSYDDYKKEGIEPIYEVKLMYIE